MKNGTKELTFQVHTKVAKPDPNGNRQQRRAAKKIVRKATK
jgi:hypothetical protein